jgi:neutral ceramidase
MKRFQEWTCLGAIAAAMLAATLSEAAAAGLRVGAASVEMKAEPTMPLAGGILAGFAAEQEGKLRAAAVVLELPGAPPAAIVSCDVLMLTRDLVDPVVAEIEKSEGIPASRILIHATHTHHAPSTVRVHGYDRDIEFCRRTQRAIVEAVAAARKRLVDASFYFAMGEERTVGQNSRLRLKDGTIYWTGMRDDVVGPSGPFDADLPVLAFRNPAGKLQALLFGHSSHTIGSLRPGVRSPAFYGMTAQAFEAELGGVALFLEGASGSTHVLDLPAAESFARIKKAVGQSLAKASPREVTQLAALKRPFAFTVRRFDEAAEEKAVVDYCTKRIGPQHTEAVANVFRKMRKELAPQQGQERTTWLSAMRIGDVAIAGVPAEFFTKLGLDIKRRSPWKNTIVVELANDWIGYLPDREGHKLGGYQVWTGFHSYAEPGTGERIVDAVVGMLDELKK